MKKRISHLLRRNGNIIYHCICFCILLELRIVERQAIVLGQPPEWYTKFEEVRKQRRLDKTMPPVNKVVEDFFNTNEEELAQEDQDSIVLLILSFITLGNEKGNRSKYF